MLSFHFHVYIGFVLPAFVPVSYVQRQDFSVCRSVFGSAGSVFGSVGSIRHTWPSLGCSDGTKGPVTRSPGSETVPGKATLKKRTQQNYPPANHHPSKA